MNTYYTYMILEGISSLLEFSYTYHSGFNGNLTWIEIEHYFDRHGDSPDITFHQMLKVKKDILQYESNRPLEVMQQQHLSMEFQLGEKFKATNRS